MGIKEKIYSLSPIFLQNILVSVAGYLNNRKRYGKTYYKHRQFLKEFDKYTLEEKNKYQEDQLIKLIKYAYNHSPFYKNLYKNVDINTIQSIKDLKLLPIVDKEMIRSNINDVVTINRKGSIVGHTGGTTGKSLVVLFQKDDRMKRIAMLDHFKSRVGFEHLQMKRATFNGKHIVPPK